MGRLGHVAELVREQVLAGVLIGGTVISASVVLPMQRRLALARRGSLPPDRLEGR